MIPSTIPIKKLLNSFAVIEEIEESKAAIN